MTDALGELGSPNVSHVDEHGEIHDAEVVPDSETHEVGTELTVSDVQAPTLFRSTDPVESLAAAVRVADALKGVLTRQGLVSRIQGRDHVRVEGWTTLGSMLGVTAVCVRTGQLDDGWEATVEARTLDGRTIGSADAMCTRSESTWKSRDEYALRSMAQTRATSKALKSVLGFVATLAGFEATPAEELPPDQAPQQPQYGPRIRETSELAFTNAILWLRENAGLTAASPGTLAGRLTELYGYFPQVAATAVVLLAQQIKDGTTGEDA